MTLRAQAWGHNTLTYDGTDMRMLAEAAVNGRSGVPRMADLRPGAAGSAFVTVAAGLAMIPATGVGLFGYYQVGNDAAVNSPSVAATGANPRWDLLILRVVLGVPQLAIVQGTAAASPAEPSLAAETNFIRIARLQINAGSSVIATVVDQRTLYPDRVTTVAADLPQQPWAGQRVHLTDSLVEQVWVGAKWEIADVLGAWVSTFVPILSQGASGNIAKTVNFSRYHRHGRKITWTFGLSPTASGTAGQQAEVTLPFAAAAYQNLWPIGVGSYGGTGVGSDRPCLWWGSGTTKILLQRMEDGAYPTTQVVSGQYYAGMLTYEAAA